MQIQQKSLIFLSCILERKNKKSIAQKMGVRKNRDTHFCFINNAKKLVFQYGFHQKHMGYMLTMVFDW
jgi:hypothetical protein